MSNDTRTPAPRFTLWIRSSIPFGVSWRPYRGKRTVAAISTHLSLLDALGAPSSLELESASSGPIPITLTELVACGVVQEETAVTTARVYFESVSRTSRRRRAPLWLADVGETVARLAAAALARVARRTKRGRGEN